MATGHAHREARFRPTAKSTRARGMFKTKACSTTRTETCGLSGSSSDARAQVAHRGTTPSFVPDSSGRAGGPNGPNYGFRIKPDDRSRFAPLPCGTSPKALQSSRGTSHGRRIVVDGQYRLRRARASSTQGDGGPQRSVMAALRSTRDELTLWPLEGPFINRPV